MTGTCSFQLILRMRGIEVISMKQLANDGANELILRFNYHYYYEYWILIKYTSLLLIILISVMICYY